MKANADPPVGAAEGCDLLILFFENQSQKIAAFGSSYAGQALQEHAAGCLDPLTVDPLSTR